MKNINKMNNPKINIFYKITLLKMLMHISMAKILTSIIDSTKAKNYNSSMKKSLLIQCLKDVEINFTISIIIRKILIRII